MIADKARLARLLGVSIPLEKGRYAFMSAYHCACAPCKHTTRYTDSAVATSAIGDTSNAIALRWANKSDDRPFPAAL